MNTFIPLTRQELIGAGETRSSLEKNFHRISSGLYLPKEAIPSEGVGRLPVATRALIAQHRYPSAVIGGWSALALRRLRYFRDDAPVIVHGRSRSPVFDSHLNIRFRGRPTEFFSEFEVGSFSVRVAPASLAAVDCLQSLAKKTHSWWVPPAPDLTFEQIRSIQVIDSVRRGFRVSFGALSMHARGRFDAERLALLWALSDPGTESPPESSLRLIVRDLADWRSQYEFRDECGIKITVADLADESSKTALFYDGEHHLARSQRDTDSWANQQLQKRGWTPIRITAGQLRNPHSLRFDLQEIMGKSSRGIVGIR